MDSFIQTVTGRLKPAELGYCQSHEHLFISEGYPSRIDPSLRLDDYQLTCSELNLYKNLGGNSIVDAQPIGCGRKADFQYAAACDSGINIISSTGFHKLVFYPNDHWIHYMDQMSLANLFIEELQNGMFINCDYSVPLHRITSLAGIIKAASDIDGPVGEYKRLFEAAAEASIQTGAAILCHTEMGRGALEQIRIFTEHGLSVDKIIICHLDRNLADEAYFMEVASTGVFIELDTIGRFKYHSDEAEARFITKIIKNGYEDQILIGLDTTRNRMKSYGGSIGLDYMFDSFLPLLKRYGISEEKVSKFVIKNPSRAFALKI